MMIKVAIKRFTLLLTLLWIWSGPSEHRSGHCSSGSDKGCGSGEASGYPTAGGTRCAAAYTNDKQNTLLAFAALRFRLPLRLVPLRLYGLLCRVSLAH